MSHTINIPATPVEALEEMLRVESRLLNDWADGMAVGMELLTPEDQHRATARLQARVSALRAALCALRGKAPATLDRPTHPYTTQQEDRRFERRVVASARNAGWALPRPGQQQQQGNRRQSNDIENNATGNPHDGAESTRSPAEATSAHQGGDV